MFIVVSYDIPNDRRRARLRRQLKSFGTRVQYSVFECLLDRQGMERMRAAVKGIIKKGDDHVRYYSLCESCAQQVQAIGGVVTQEVRTAVV
jgi:CRISPR-associated protein Cas2